MNWLNLASRYNYKQNYYHAMLLDPPYHLTSITDRFSKGTLAKYGTDGAFQRASKGFMGQTWDGGDLAFNPELWAALKERLLPGTFCFAFAGSRGWHRMATAIEDAGFIMHPTIFLWAYGCLSDDTEILTKDGWQYFQPNLLGSMVLGYNVKNNSLEWVEVQETYEYDYNDTAYHIQSDSTDQIVSCNHRCLIKRNGKFVFRQAETLESEESLPILETLPELQQAIQRSECGQVLEDKSLLKNLCDKNIFSETQGKKGQTSQSSSKPETDTKGQNHNLSSLRKEEIQTSRLVTKSKSANLFSAMQRSIKRSRMGQACLQRTSSLDRRKQPKFSRKDGWFKKSSLEGWSYLPKAKRKLCQLQYQICEVSRKLFAYGSQGWLYNGASSFSSTSYGQNFETFRSSTPYKPQSRRQQSKKSNAIQQQLSTQKTRSDWKLTTTLATVTPIRYKGRVWCVRVPTRAFIARRNGKIFITGNSGFPKATRIGTQIDKAAGAERKVVGTYKMPPDSTSSRAGKDFIKVKASNYLETSTFKRSENMGKNITAPATLEVAEWEGHRYGLQAIKPATEPILCFQKPYKGKPLDSIVKTGAGALNIEKGRIGTDRENEREYDKENASGKTGSKESSVFISSNNKRQDNWLNKGRWPSNFLLQHSPDCKRVGVKKVKPGTKEKAYFVERKRDGLKISGSKHNVQKANSPDNYGNESIANWLCVEECPVKKLDEQSGELKSGGTAGKRNHPPGNIYGTYQPNEYKKGEGIAPSSGGASRFFFQADFTYEVAEQIAASDPVRYVAKASSKERSAGLTNPSIHPTVKPIALTKYLASLLLPPDSYTPRRILVPFSGSGSEMIGALLAGWDEVTGIEMTKKYIPIAKARLEWWTSFLKWGQDDIDVILDSEDDNQQLSFLDNF